MLIRSSDTKSRFPLIRSVLSNENGAALIIGLMFVAILGLVGTTAVVMTTTDLKIGGNYKTNTQAFNAAQAGLDEARLRLEHPAADPAGDPATPPDPNWSAYIITSTSLAPSTYDREYNNSYTNYFPDGTNQSNTTLMVNTLQTGSPYIQYLVKIRHKREYDAIQAGHTSSTPHYADGDGDTSNSGVDSNNSGSIIYYGDDPATPDSAEWVEFTTSGTPTSKEARPVEVIRAYGYKNNGLSPIEIAVEGLPLGIDADAPLYAKDNVTGNGSSLSVDANGPASCPASTTHSIYTYYAPSDPPTSTTLHGTPTLDPPTSSSGHHDVPITELVETISYKYDIKINQDQNNGTFGSSTDSVICYSDTSDPYNNQGLKMNNLTGWGALVVKGDLELGGGFTWYGPILVTGTLTFNGGGGSNSINIEGAVMANQTVTINGNIDLQYNSCYISDALSSGHLKVVSWKQIY